jgi:hypothetical protein
MNWVMEKSGVKREERDNVLRPYKGTNTGSGQKPDDRVAESWGRKLVDVTGFEPATSCLQSTRSPS